MIDKLLTEHHLEFLTGLPESTLVKIPHCWKSHVMAQSLLLSLIHMLQENVTMFFLCF